MGEVRHWYKNLLRGRVYFDNRRESIDCLVGDISAQGARIIFSDEVTIPDFIDLNIPQREQTIHACVEWHVGNELGLSFIDAAHASSAPLEFGYYLARRVAQLELELASLRRAIKRLTGVGHY
jgi:hypothetical protein